MSKNRLPEKFASSGDPVDRNPFPPDDLRQRVWADATRKAEEKVARIHARRLASLEALPADAFVHREIAVPVGRFDAWAERGIQVVWSDAAMAHYDQWLVLYANALLEAFGDQYKTTPIVGAAEDHAIHDRLTDTLLGSLGARVQFWKAEARRFRAQQEQSIAEEEARAQTPSVLPKIVGAAVKQRRKVWLKKYRDDQALTAEGLARRVGISDTAIRGIVNEDRGRFSEAKRDQLLRTLGISLARWYEP